MDFQKSLEVLTSEGGGVKWNGLRQAGGTVPDLSGAKLSRCDLRDANFEAVVLRGAFFGGSDLHRADLSGADLRDADMPACNLVGANLRNADLRSANLRSANVFGANLEDADLRGANLFSVDLSSAALPVVDVADVGVSMRRIDKLFLDEDLKQFLFEVLQKLDLLNDLTDPAKQQAATHVDNLIKALLKSPFDASRIQPLLALMTAIAPPLVGEASRTFLVAPRASASRP